MAYVRFEPGFSRHPKRLKEGPVAAWLWACSVDYCVEHLTDGFLIAEAVPSLVPGLSKRERERCVSALLDTKAWELSPGGYQVHDFGHHQVSATEVRADRDAGKRRARAWRDAKRTGERAPLRPAHEQGTYETSSSDTKRHEATRSRKATTPDPNTEDCPAPETPGGLLSQQGQNGNPEDSNDDQLLDAAAMRAYGISADEARKRRVAARSGL